MGATLNGDHEGHSHPQRWVAAGGIVTLMESAAFLATVAVGLSIYDCSLNTSSDVVWEMTRLYYFSHESCNPYRVEGNDYNIDGLNSAANRTVIFMSIYIVLYCTWFIGSILLLVTASKGKQIKPNLARNLQYVWTLPTGCIILLDLIATILYSVDLMSTTDFESVMGLVNIKVDGSVVEFKEDYLSDPPMIMALLASKAGLLWVINVVIFIILLVQFNKLFLVRKQQQYVQAQLSTMPAYLWPPKLADKSQPPNRDAPTPPPVIPRLMNHEGLGIVAAPQHSGTMGGPRRPSALQIAARQGFSYERPNSGAWSPTNPAFYSHANNQRTSSPQGGYQQENPENWYSRNENMPPRENERQSNILQRDNDVFY